MRVHVLAVRTSIMYGGLGRIYGTYRGEGCSLRNCTPETAWGQRQTQNKQVQTWDRPAPNDPCLLHNQPSAEDASFSEPCHQAADVGPRVRGLECAGHQPQEPVEVGDAAVVPM